MRSAIRSKLVVLLLGCLFVSLIGLPLTIRGDGTLAGHVYILLRYSLGLATLILSLATLWASCAAVASDIRDRQIQMVVSKPVRPMQLWLGKWLGLVLLNGALLFVCFTASYAAVRWITHPERLTPVEQAQVEEDILVAQRRVAPRERDVSAAVQAEYQAGRARGEWPAEVATRDILPVLERRVRAQANAVHPGDANRWVFDVPRLPDSGQPLRLRYRANSSGLDLTPVRAVWRVGAPDRVDRQETSVEIVPRTWHTLTIPSDLLGPDRTLTIELASAPGTRATLLFDPSEDLRLMIEQGHFLTNYLRAALLILFHLAFLAAIGLTCGTLFSIPVATLVGMYVLLLLNVGRFIGQLAAWDVHVAQTPDAGWFMWAVAHVTRAIYWGLNLILQPVIAENPLAFVAAGEWLGWGTVGATLGVKVGVYVTVIMGLGAWHLSRKEVALPS